MAGIAVTKVEQPQEFVFSAENVEKANAIIAKYPEGKQASAVIPLLDIAQRQHQNWLPRAAMDYIASMLDMAPIRVYEVATFYTMFNLQPVGTYFIQICRTTPCWLRGSDDITNICKEVLGIGIGETTKDGMFTLVEVECLGTCANAPMVQVNDNYYEDLTVENMKALIDKLRAGESVDVGSQTGRLCSAPEGERTSLKSV